MNQILHEIRALLNSVDDINNAFRESRRLVAINLRIVKDKAGNLRANTDDSYGPLAWYLEQDIQSGLEHGEQMLEICSRIINQDGEWSGTGNAHSVTVTRTKVRIKNEFVEGAAAACELSLDEFRESLSLWLQAVRSKALS